MRIFRKSAKKTLHNTHEILKDTSEIRSLVDILIKEVKSQQNSSSPELPRDTETAITQYIKRAKTFISSDSSMTDDTVAVDDLVEEQDIEILEEQKDDGLPEVPATAATDNLIDERNKSFLLEKKYSDLPEVLVSPVSDNRIDEGSKESLLQQKNYDLPESPLSPVTNNLIDERNKKTLLEQKYTDPPETLVRPVTDDLIDGENKVNGGNKADREIDVDKKNKADRGNKIDEGKRVDSESNIDEGNQTDGKDKVDRGNKIGLEEQRNNNSSEIPVNLIIDESQTGSQIHSKPIRVSQEAEEKSKRALIVAAANGNLKMITFLLDLISDVNMVDERLGTALQTQPRCRRQYTWRQGGWDASQLCPAVS